VIKVDRDKLSEILNEFVGDQCGFAVCGAAEDDSMTDCRDAVTFAANFIQSEQKYKGVGVGAKRVLTRRDSLTVAVQHGEFTLGASDS
jgi:hypothetical protein